VLLVGIPGSAFAVSLMTFADVNFYQMSLPASLLALYLPPVAVGGLAIAAIRRSNRPAPQAHADPDAA